MERILLGMSGGVDSTWAVRVLQQMGYSVEGAVLRMHAFTEVDAAKESAAAMGVPLHVVDCEERFSSVVIADFLREYRAGRTPNPCILCNPEVKFRGLLEYAKDHGFDGIATGHYAGVRKTGGRYAVTRAKDPTKDQSYMLYRLDQEVLSHLILPLAGLAKRDVTAAAKEANALAAEREESQEICFIRGEGYADYIERACGASVPGAFVNEKGERIGTHRGICHYTVGQRKGLGVSAATRLFVREIRPESNTIVLSDAPESPVTSFRLVSPVFQAVPPEAAEGSFRVMLRYRAEPVPCTVRMREDGLRVELETPVRAVTPGQSAVLYREDAVAFGGLIG